MHVSEGSPLEDHRAARHNVLENPEEPLLAEEKGRMDRLQHAERALVAAALTRLAVVRCRNGAVDVASQLEIAGEGLESARRCLGAREGSGLFAPKVEV